MFLSVTGRVVIERGRWSRALRATGAVVLGVPLVVAAVSVSALIAPTAAHAAAPSAVTEYQPSVPTKYGGRSVAVTIDPNDTSVVLVATESGGLFRSTDGGAHWSHVDSLVPARLADVKFAPDNGSVALVTTLQTSDSTNPGGIYRSSDSGVTWTRVAYPDGTGGCGANFNAWGIAFEPTSTNAYAGTDCGLMTSTDQGATFRLTAIPRTHAVVARASGPLDVCADDGHYRFTNNNGTLTKVSGPDPIPAADGGTAGGCPGPFGYADAYNLAGVPGDGDVLFTMRVGAASATDCGGTNDNKVSPYELMESDDAGVHWAVVGSACPSRLPWVETHASRDGQAGDFDIYYSGGLDISRGTCTAGGTGQRCTGLPTATHNVDIGHADPSGVAFALDSTNCALYEVDDGGIEKSGDCGGSFSLAAGSGSDNGGFNALQVYEVNGQLHPDHTDLWFGTQDNSIYGSSDNGATWPNNDCCEGFGFQAPRTAPSDDGQRLTYVTCGPCSNRKSGIHLDGPGGWSDPPGKAVGADAGYPVLLRPSADTYVQWRETGTPPIDQLYLTTDAGSNWTAVSGATINTGLVSHPFVAGPGSSPTIYQLTNGGSLVKITGVNSGNPVKVTTLSGVSVGTYDDGQGAWRPNEPAFGVDPNNPLHLIAADTGTDTMKVSTDGGATWTTDAALTAAVTGNGRFTFTVPMWGTQTHAIAFSPTDANTILVGTEAAGIVASTDGGKTWATMPGSQQVTAVTSFLFDEVRHDIIVSSYGRGLWKLALPNADLSITKTATSDTVVAGTELDYTITVTNHGPDAAPDATVVDQLPPQLSFISASLTPPQGCTAAGQTVTCDLGTLGNGDTVTFTLKTMVAADAVSGTGPAALNNTATVSATGSSDPNPGNNSSSASVTVQDKADLSVSKLCKPDTTVPAGKPLTCTVFVDNHGPSAARAVTVDDTILSNGNFTVSNVDPPLGGGTPGCTLTPVTGGQKLTCALGNLGAATSTNPGRATITYQITANEGQDLDNLATVRSDTPDPQPDNNSAEVTLTITAVADLGLTATDSPDPAIAGTGLTWTLSATNAGPSTSTNVRITDEVPAGVVVTSVTGTGGATCKAGTPGDPLTPATCAFGSLASGQTATMTINAKINSGTTGQLDNSARVWSDTLDTNNANDLATTTTQVNTSADLALTFTSDSPTAKPSTTIHYKVTVDNLGPSDAAGTVVTVNLPPLKSGFYVSDNGGCTLQNVTLSCPLGTVVAGSPTRTILVDWFVQGAKFPIVASASVAAQTADPVAGNNSGSASVDKG